MIDARERPIEFWLHALDLARQFACWEEPRGWLPTSKAHVAKLLRAAHPNIKLQERDLANGDELGPREGDWIWEIYGLGLKPWDPVEIITSHPYVVEKSLAGKPNREEAVELGRGLRKPAKRAQAKGRPRV